MTCKLFGTDGIRGKFGNPYHITDELLFKICISLSQYMNSCKYGNSIVVGFDTRQSSGYILSCLAFCFRYLKIDLSVIGVAPTAAVSYVTKSQKRKSMGIMITASHNPYQDNGLKIFDFLGMKLSDKIQEEIETLIYAIDPSDHALEYFKNNFHPGIFPDINQKYAREYIDYILSFVTEDLKDMKIVVDPANGASVNLAKTVFEQLNVNAIFINSDPNGKNINEKCGSNSPESLQQRVLSEKADLGIAFDGDGDRLLVVDENGGIVDGDQLIASIALYLGIDHIVVTVMSNYSLEEYFSPLKVKITRSKVGDRYIKEGMIKNDAKFGAEQSGHIIIGSNTSVGDAILSSINIMCMLKKNDSKASSEFTKLQLYPQKTVSIDIQDHIYQDETYIRSLSDKFNSEIGGLGRVLIRKSGTEKCIRITVEHKDIEKVELYLQKIISLFHQL